MGGEMTTLQLFNAFLVLMVILAALVVWMLTVAPAGYGQYVGKRWGKTINNKVGWVIMEIPVVIVFLIYWLASERTFETTPLVFFLLFNLHYCQRTFIFPLLIRGDDQMPWSIIIFGMIFNTANAFMQGTWIFFLAPDGQYTPAWLLTPQFIIGAAVFLAGFVINLHSDHIIRNLRKPGDTAFHIPRGGMFRYVTAANYLGELTEWVGWAVMTWSWAGLVFAVWTFANLGPRAHTHHNWYIKKFGDEYPRDRKRMIPFVY
jgi:3-oxo-5-alpha-steroid 4-dehydrogenase 1